jgi:diketogulonate reductase-like aldo/keto reductase
MGWLAKGLTDEAKNAAVASLEAIAADLGITVAQLAIAWAARNPHVSTVITGASNVAQLRANLAAVDVIAKLTPEVLARIDAVPRCRWPEQPPQPALSRARERRERGVVERGELLRRADVLQRPR